MEVPSDRRVRSGSVRGGPVVELVRLTVVLLFIVLGYSLGPAAAALTDEYNVVAARLVTSLLGALTGYVLGGISGRGLIRGVDIAEARLRRVEAGVLISAVLGATLAGLLAMLLLWPLLLLPAKQVTAPIAMGVLIGVIYSGGRLGAARGGDLLRFLGARGRLEVISPSRGQTAKLVDTSALIDARMVDVARAGFLDGTLVIPQFVLRELQALADTEEPRRRNAGRRGLDTLRVLQQEGVVAVEVTDEDVAEMADVDAKLVELARRRQGPLLTVDANLARVAEVTGVKVLSVHALAEAVRPPVLPGERVPLAISRTGREPGQGVGHLPDGTMVVVERAGDRVGDKVVVEVTSLLQTRNGRMVFATLAGSDGEDALAGRA